MSATIPHGRLRQLRPGEMRRRLVAAEARAQALNDALVAVAAAWPASAVQGTTYSDPVIARRQARRQRIAASGLTVVR